MGQYYRVYVETKNNEIYVFDGNVDGDFTFPKLMEHSWWNNPFVNSICHLIHHKPKKVAWIGDYAVDDALYGFIWSDDGIEPQQIEEAQVVLNDKYLVNHSQKIFIDCNKYYRNSLETETGWCIHPLPLLTAIGNGRGNGDYRSKNGIEHVGTWAKNYISVENEIPIRYSEIDLTFKE